jgi:AP endonuclease-2
LWWNLPVARPFRNTGDYEHVTAKVHFAKLIVIFLEILVTMVIRITSWNVNGIRNPFSYQPWNQSRTFAAMFDTLEADIVIMQETKIQRKDLRDDMVLVPGWDVYFSLPKHKKGYSGVAIYTRNSVCAPIRAEEGITGVLCPPNSSIKFCELPEDQQIGGYPRPGQLSDVVDETTLDSEGRCVILEFPAFVLIGTYSPATRDETRDDFRLGYIAALDARVRNLVAMGKRVVLTGDLNVIGAAIDTAGNIVEHLKKESMSLEDFISTPSRRIFNQLIFNGTVYGERDEGREEPVLWDLGRLFNPTRQGMFTCWDTKKNTRPGNFGSRIDYVLCSDSMKEWVVGSNIQEGLMGSDHCPIFALLGDSVQLGEKEVQLRDIMNPPGVFQDGKRLREWSTKDLLPLSARLIPEFDRRQSIKDMFFKKPGTTPKVSSTPTNEPAQSSTDTAGASVSQTSAFSTPLPSQAESSKSAPSPSKAATVGVKRTPSSPASNRSQKKAKATLSRQPSTSKGQTSLTGFFKPKSTGSLDKRATNEKYMASGTGLDGPADAVIKTLEEKLNSTVALEFKDAPTPVSPDRVFDPIESKESWSRLLGKRVVPKCEHGENCISLVTKKPGVNCGKYTLSSIVLVFSSFLFPKTSSS